MAYGRNNPPHLEELVAQLSVSLSAGLLELLEGKHLYQKVICTLSDRGRRTGAYSQELLAILAESPLGTSRVQPFAKYNLGEIETPTLTPTNVKLFCRRCKQREVFAPKALHDLSTPERDALASPASMLPDGEQLFALNFLCQRCHQGLVGFLIKRHGWTLSLEGRYPFEHIELPTYLPQQEAERYRNAMIGAHAGQILAAKFSLRVFVEQFARRITGISDRTTGTEILDAYAQTIPQQQKDLMPSLKSIYERLSEAIHKAQKNENLFFECRDEVDRHFDIRRVFNL